MRRPFKIVLTSMASVLAITALQFQTAPAQAAFSGVQNHAEWDRVDPPGRKFDVQADCDCTGTWTGNDGFRDGNYWREIEYLHSDGFSLIYYRQADDGTWRIYWKKRWVDFDGPDETVLYNG